jgi:hypothetical protein
VHDSSQCVSLGTAAPSVLKGFSYFNVVIALKRVVKYQYVQGLLIREFNIFDYKDCRLDVRVYFFVFLNSVFL